MLLNERKSLEDKTSENGKSTIVEMLWLMTNKNEFSFLFESMIVYVITFWQEITYNLQMVYLLSFLTISKVSKHTHKQIYIYIYICVYNVSWNFVFLFNNMIISFSTYLLFRRSTLHPGLQWQFVNINVRVIILTIIAYYQICSNI